MLVLDKRQKGDWVLRCASLLPLLILALVGPAFEFGIVGLHTQV